MTNRELKTKIANAKNVDWHKSIEETFNFSYIEFVQTFKGISAIYEFINQQIKGWEIIEEPLPNELLESKKYFINIKNSIIQFVTNFTETQDENLLHYWSTTKNLINNTNQKPIPFNSSQAIFLIEAYKARPEYFSGAFNYIVGRDYTVNSKELLYGAILAYEYTLKDPTGIISRKKAEQKSISQLKADFQNYISESESFIIDHLKNANDKYKEYTTHIDNLKTEKETLFNEWFDNIQIEEWAKWYQEKIDKLEKLEATYETKLKLEKPAKYWETKSNKYYEEGKRAKTILIWIVVITSVFLGAILIISPDWIFNKVFSGNSTAVIRWSLVFITLLTLIAFTVKAITKYMFSSYHLARDAEERHTLTFFYLALIKDTEVNSEDRNLILKSLFSRVETGLLKEDSSPTMPSDTISKLISK